MRGVLPWGWILAGVCLALVILSGPPSTGLTLAAFPTITFDSGSGSDTAASGSGGTALSGTAASITSASAVVSLATDSPNLAGVATDGSAAIWVDSSTGRQYGRITAVDNGAKTVTAHGNFGATESGKNWGIGGARATLDHADSRTLWADFEAGWTVSLADDQTLTSSAISLTVNGSTTAPILVKSSVAGTVRKITTTANAALFATTGTTGSNYQWQDLNVASSNATKANGAFIITGSGTGPGDNWRFLRVKTDATDKVGRLIYRAAVDNPTPDIVCISCEIQFCTLTTSSSGAIRLAGANSALVCLACDFHDNAGDAVYTDDGRLVFWNCIFDTNAADGIQFEAATLPKVVVNCTFYNNNVGIRCGQAASSLHMVVFNNLFVTNTTGIVGSASPQTPAFLDYNGFYNNTTDITNLSAGAHDITGTDPQFVDAANRNFAIQASAYKGTAFPIGGSEFIGGPGGATYSYIDMGAAQVQPSSSGGLLIHPGMSGGLRG